MELSGSNIKKLLIFSQNQAFITQPNIYDGAFIAKIVSS